MEGYCAPPGSPSGYILQDRVRSQSREAGPVPRCMGILAAATAAESQSRDKATTTEPSLPLRATRPLSQG